MTQGMSLPGCPADAPHSARSGVLLRSWESRRGSGETGFWDGMWHWVSFPLLWMSKALSGVGGNGDTGTGEGTGPSAVLCYLLGREISASEPRDTPRLRRMKAVKGFSRNSTSPTATWAASAPGGTFFLNLFLS